MKYVAWLRGINVGGKGKVSMAELALVVEKCGYTNVVTYINSGNVVFVATGETAEKITHTLEHAFEKAFHFPIPVVLRSEKQIEKTLEEMPSSWKKNADLRCYLAFVKEPVTPEEVASSIKINEAVDAMDLGPGVVYMSTKMSGLTKSGFTKLVGTKIYQSITLRNLNTAKKIWEIMQRE